MKKEYLKYLACPQCNRDLVLEESREDTSGLIETGSLKCLTCGLSYPIVNHIPRFVPIENYASNFGLEWKLHSKTQYDKYSRSNISEKRFFEETKWGRDLKGQTILEVGSGSGRFTEQAISTRAFVISVDYSNAVEVNYAANGKNCFIIQGDIYHLPLKKEFFDKVLCIGVLQHTPDVKLSFLSLLDFLKVGGSIVVDVYKKNWATIFNTRYYVRPFVKDIAPPKLYEYVKKYIDLMWPLACLIRKIPKIGRAINWKLLIEDYSNLDLKDDMLKEWAYLDTFDVLSPAFDQPQTLRTVRKWCMEAGLGNIDVNYGYNGIECRAMKVKKEQE